MTWVEFLRSVKRGSRLRRRFGIESKTPPNSTRSFLVSSENNTLKTARLFTLLIVAFIAATNAFAQQNVQKIDGLMKQYYDYGQFNGSVLVAEKGKVIYKKGFGMANMEWAIPNQSDTKFRIGSVTKQFTATLVLQLVEEGKIKLDGKISDYLPDYRKDTGEKVTIHQLLNHTSGIPSYTSSPDFFAEFSRNRIVSRISSKNLRVAILNSSQDRNSVTTIRVILFLVQLSNKLPESLTKRF